MPLLRLAPGETNSGSAALKKSSEKINRPKLKY